jgi:hypothetical protein
MDKAIPVEEKQICGHEPQMGLDTVTDHRSWREFNFDLQVSRMEAGSNTFTVAPLVVKRPRKGYPLPGGYNWVTLFLRDINNGDLAIQVGRVSNLRQ